MKCVVRDRNILCVLKNANSKLRKVIIKNCDDCVIRTLAEIVHNMIAGNVRMNVQTLKKMKRYKRDMRLLHGYIQKNKSNKGRRKRFVNQVGGFWPLLLQGVLSAALSYGGEKLLEYGTKQHE